MAHRVGTCRTCRTKFQIPASFAPNQAKCRNCGGVVEIGPPEGAPQPVAQRAAPPPAAPRAEPVAPLPTAPVRAPAPAHVAAPASPPARREPAMTEPVAEVPARRRGLVPAILLSVIAVVVVIVLMKRFG